MRYRTACAVPLIELGTPHNPQHRQQSQRRNGSRVEFVIPSRGATILRLMPFMW
jgi:hypothetical protein